MSNPNQRRHYTDDELAQETLDAVHRLHQRVQCLRESYDEIRRTREPLVRERDDLRRKLVVVEEERDRLQAQLDLIRRNR